MLQSAIFAWIASRFARPALSTNGASLNVDDSASVNIAETLKVGASDTATGTVTVANGGTITARSLDIFNANSSSGTETLEIKGVQAYYTATS